MQRPMRRMGNGPARRPGGARPPMRGGPQRMPGRGPAQWPLRRAFRPHDGRTAVFVAGSETLHKFVTSRLSTRSDIWIAQALSARNYAQGTAFCMKPDVTIVDVDPIWNPAGLPLARDLAEACPEAHLIMIAPEGYPQGPRIATAAVEPGWSAILRRKSDNGERLLQAIVAGLGGESWVDPDLGGPQSADENGAGGQDSSGGRDWDEGLDGDEAENGEPDGAAVAGETANAEVEEWKRRARSGMG